MRRATTLAAVVVLALAALRAAPGEAAITLELRIDAALPGDVHLHIGARNRGDEGAENARPEVTLLGTTVRGEPKTIPPEFEVAWDLTLPRPTVLGTLPILVQLRYEDPFGQRLSAPAVHVLRTAGAPDGRVALAIEASPVTEGARGTATVRVENPEDAPVSGTLGVWPSAELGVTPAGRPVELAPGATLSVPIEIENRGALAGSTTALWAWLELERPSHVETLTANTAVAIVAPPDPKQSRNILLVIAGAVAVALLLWGIRRLLRPAAAPRTRAERRRR